MPTSLTQIFLSYPIEDEKQAYDLYQQLGEAGFKTWMFSQDLQPGASTVTGPEQVNDDRGAGLDDDAFQRADLECQEGLDRQPGLRGLRWAGGDRIQPAAGVEDKQAGEGDEGAAHVRRLSSPGWSW